MSCHLSSWDAASSDASFWTIFNKEFKYNFDNKNVSTDLFFYLFAFKIIHFITSFVISSNIKSMDKICNKYDF